MIGAVKIINYICNHALHLRVFEVLCERIGLQHHHLVSYAEVIRFSRRHVLARLFNLREANKFPVMCLTVFRTSTDDLKSC